VFRHQLRSNFRIGGRFSAGHRQRTLTNVAHDTTRPRTPSEESRTRVVSRLPPAALDRYPRGAAGHVAVPDRFILSLSEKERRKSGAVRVNRTRNSARVPSPLRSRRG